jgi:hypothetical protein
MKAFILLCDSAQEYSKKLHILGGGWTRILRAGLPRPVAIAAYLLFEPDEREPEDLPVTFRLLKDDGSPVLTSEDIDDAKPVVAKAKVTSKRYEKAHPGLPLGVPLVLQVGNLMLDIGLYRWELEVGGEKVSEVVFEVAEKL